MDWRVRLASEADAEQLAPVLRSAYPSIDAPGADPDALARALADVTDPPIHLLRSGRFFVAEAGGRLIGCGGWSFKPPRGVAEASGVGHLRHFAVHRDVAGRGVGRSLYEAARDQCSAEGGRRIDVVSSPDAERFYRALGFESLGPFAVSIAGLSLPSVYMTRRIDG